ncbi:hypothetical protein MFLAVUS_009777 [Mucor flavus]|uniref:Uncharacterized protein n=1 Tax=Mucor flavus TaxID=439312 RepID=A0ABP9ZAU3_9FUNG
MHPLPDPFAEQSELYTISSGQSEDSPNSIMEYKDMLESQTNLDSLHELGADIVTLVRYKVVECRPASVSTSYSEIIQYTAVFELFAFLLLDIAKPEEALGLVKVPSDETVAHYLM